VLAKWRSGSRSVSFVPGYARICPTREQRLNEWIIRSDSWNGRIVVDHMSYAVPAGTRVLRELKGASSSELFRPQNVAGTHGRPLRSPSTGGFFMLPLSEHPLFIALADLGFHPPIWSLASAHLGRPTTQARDKDRPRQRYVPVHYGIRCRARVVRRFSMRTTMTKPASTRPRPATRSWPT
jgi:hypothetical protein